MICVSVGRTRHSAMQADHQEAAARGVGLVELRIDYLAKTPDLAVVVESAGLHATREEEARGLTDGLAGQIEALIELRNGDDADAIEQGIKDTDKASQDFASRRMDKSIRAALSGQSVDDI